MTEQLKKVTILGIVLATAILAIFTLLSTPFSPESPALAQQAASGELPTDNPPVNFRVKQLRRHMDIRRLGSAAR